MAQHFTQDPITNIYTENPTDPKPSRGKKRKAGGIFASVFIAGVLVLGAFAGYKYYESTLPVLVTVEGNTIEVDPHTSLSQLQSQIGATTKDGDLISAGTSSMLIKGGGTTSKVIVNGQPIQDDPSVQSVSANDSIEYKNGTDIIEETEITTATKSPVIIPHDTLGTISFIEDWGSTGKTETQIGKISGEVVSSQDLTPAKDRIIGSQSPSPSTPMVALTFDDGPSPYTPKVLKILADHGAKGTFFEVGNSIKTNPETSKMVVDAGCQIASHSSAHADLTTLDGQALRDDLNATSDAIYDATGVRTHVLRPPYGSISTKTWAQAGDSLSYDVIWSVDSEDWKLPGVNQIVDTVKTHTYNGSIILMHDGGGNRDQTIEALPQILDWLNSQGYQCVTVDELLKADGNFSADIINETSHVPEGEPQEVSEA